MSLSRLIYIIFETYLYPNVILNISGCNTKTYEYSFRIRVLLPSKTKSQVQAAHSKQLNGVIKVHMSGRI